MSNVNHWEAWERPALDVLQENINARNLDKEVEASLVDELAAGVFHQMLDPDDDSLAYLQKAYPNGHPEILKEVLNVVPLLTGDALDRSIKLGYITTYAEDLLNDALKQGGVEAVKEVLKQQAEEANEKVPSNGMGGESHGGDWMASGITAPPKSIKKSNVLNYVLKFLQYDAFQAKKVEEYIKDEDGSTGKFKAIESLSDVTKMSISELMPYDGAEEQLLLDIISSKLYYFEPQEQLHKTTDLILMIDDSGSMCDEHKIAWVKALIICMYEKVANGEGCLYIVMFERMLSPATQIKSVADRDKFLQRFHGGYGGTTDIQACLEELIVHVKSGTLPSATGPLALESDETNIFIINDGNDWIQASFDPGHLTHCVTLYTDNADLASVIQRTGGTAVRVDEKDNLSLYPQGTAGLSLYDADAYDY